MELSAVQNYLNVIDNPNSSQVDITAAETKVKQFIQNIGKMCKTIEERTNWTIPSTGYTNNQLINKGII